MKPAIALKRGAPKGMSGKSSVPLTIDFDQYTSWLDLILGALLSNG